MSGFLVEEVEKSEQVVKHDCLFFFFAWWYDKDEARKAFRHFMKLMQDPHRHY